MQARRRATPDLALAGELARKFGSGIDRVETLFPVETLQMTDGPELLRELSARTAAGIWQASCQGAPLEGEDAYIARFMKIHSEWSGVWDALSSYQDSGVEIEEHGEVINPLLHVMIDAAVQRQLDEERPERVVQVRDMMTANGIEDLDVIHIIGRALVEEMWEIGRHGREHDTERYLTQARRYAQEEIKRRRRKPRHP